MDDKNERFYTELSRYITKKLVPILGKDYYTLSITHNGNMEIIKDVNYTFNHLKKILNIFKYLFILSVIINIILGFVIWRL